MLALVWATLGPHFKSECPELKLLDAGIQNLNMDDCDEEHNLFSAADGYGLVQKQAKGVQGNLPPYHDLELLLNMKKQARGLIGHSNAGLCGMDSVVGEHVGHSIQQTTPELPSA